MIGVASRRTTLISLALAAALTLSVLLAGGGPARAYPDGWTVNTVAGPYADGNATSVSVESWTDHVWIAGRGGVAPDAIWVQHSSDKGANWEAPFYLEDGTFLTDDPVVIAGTNRGDGTPRVFVIYSSQRDTGRYNTWIARSEDYGATWDDYGSRWHTTDTNCDRMKHRADHFPGSNNVAWVCQRSVGASYIWETFYGGRIRSAAGDVQYYGKMISPEDGLHSYEPDIACLLEDEAYIVWTNEGGGGYSRANIRFAYTDNFGSSWGNHGAASDIVGYDPDYRHSNPRIKSVGDKPVVLCSLEYPATGSWYVGRYYFDGLWKPFNTGDAKVADTGTVRPYPCVNGQYGAYEKYFYRNTEGKLSYQHSGGTTTDLFGDTQVYGGSGLGNYSIDCKTHHSGAATVVSAAVGEDGKIYFRHTDATAPTGSITEPAGDVYYNADFQVKSQATDDFPCTGTDVATGVQYYNGIKQVTYQYSTNGINWNPLPCVGSSTSYTPPYTVVADVSAIGEETIKLKAIATDSGGAVGEAQSVGWVVIDYTDPVTSAAYEPPNGSGFYSSSVEVELGITDVNPKGCFYRIYEVGEPPGPWQVYTSPFTVSGDNNWRVQYYSDDLSGNSDPTHIFTVNIDTTFPVTSLSTDTTPNANGWRNANTQVSLIVDEINFDFTKYRINAGTWQTYGSPFLLENGVYNVEYYSHDLAGNEEAHKSGIVRVDTVDPVTSLGTDTTPNGAGWRDSNTAVTLTPSDVTSGTDDTRYTVNGGSEQVYSSSFILEDGIWNVEYWSVDLAGNEEAHKSGIVRVDTVDTVTSLGTDTTPNANGWRNEDTEIILSPSDTLSGPDQTKYRIRNGEDTWGTWQTFILPLDFSDGEWDVEYYSTDFANNEESHKTGTVRIDTENPEVSFDTNTTPNSNNWRNKTTVVTLSCNDSNPDELTYNIVNRDSSLRASNWTNYYCPFDVPDGKWEVKYYSIDKAGNDSTVGFIDLNVDTYAPTCVVLKPERDSVQTGFTSEQMCEVVGLANDENGIDYQRLTVENKIVKEQNKAGEMSYIWDVGKVGEGVYEIIVEAVDPADNSSSSTKNVSLGNYCRDWYFAEGNTLSEFDQFFCIQNPGDHTANVSFNFMLETGETVTHDVVIGPQTRSTYNIKEFVEEGHHVSTHIKSDDQAIIAERPMYFNYKNSQGTQWKGGHIAMGLNSLQKEFYFAEGTTRRNDTDGIFDEWLTIQNPSDDIANVKIIYMLGTGDNIEKEYQVIPHSRSTVNVPNDVGLQQDVSTKIESDVPIAAERPMYFNYHGFAEEGHNVVGIPSPSKTWYFAEGSTQAGFEEWITIQNPNNEDAKLKFKYMTSTGEIIEKEKEVPKRSRHTVDVPLDAGKGKDISVEIASDVPVVCERPMYFNYKGKWRGGSNVMGATTLSDTFYIAEGATIENFDTYYTAANPSGDRVDITIKYMFGDGETEEKMYTLEAHSRLTINVNSEIGGGKDVSSEITTSDGSKIMVERPMYFDYHGMSGGHVVNAYGVN